MKKLFLVVAIILVFIACNNNTDGEKTLPCDTTGLQAALDYIHYRGEITTAVIDSFCNANHHR